MKCNYNSVNLVCTLYSVKCNCLPCDGDKVTMTIFTHDFTCDLTFK